MNEMVGVSRPELSSQSVLKLPPALCSQFNLYHLMGASGSQQNIISRCEGTSPLLPLHPNIQMLAGSPSFSDTLYIQHTTPTGKSLLHGCGGVGFTLISSSPHRINYSDAGTEPFALKTFLSTEWM